MLPVIFRDDYMHSTKSANFCSVALGHLIAQDNNSLRGASSSDNPTIYEIGGKNLAIDFPGEKTRQESFAMIESHLKKIETFRHATGDTEARRRVLPT